MGADCLRAARPVQARVSVASVRICATPVELMMAMSTRVGRGARLITVSHPSALDHSERDAEDSAQPSSAAGSSRGPGGRSVGGDSVGGAGSNAYGEDAEEPLQLCQTTATRACRQPPRAVE